MWKRNAIQIQINLCNIVNSMVWFGRRPIHSMEMFMRLFSGYPHFKLVFLQYLTYDILPSVINEESKS